MKMTEKEAKEYLKRKGYNEDDKKQVKEIMNKGKIYGDPVVEIDF